MNRKPFLLPNYFKWIGPAILVLTVATIIIANVAFDFNFVKIIWLKLIVKILIALSFMLFILAKEKVEDEFIMQCRLRAMAGIFILNFFCSIFSELTKTYCPTFFTPIFGSLFGVGVFQAMMYITTFYSLKKGYAQ